MDELMAPLEAMIKEVKQKFGGFSEERSLLEVIMGFLHAVDWTEPWLIGLLCGHFILLAAVVGLRKYTTLQSILFTGMVLTIYQSERINKLLGLHWRSFAKQNYFDPEGFFISTMLSIPWLFLLLIMVAMYIFQASTLMVTLKRKQLIQAGRQQQVQGDTAPKEAKKTK